MTGTSVHAVTEWLEAYGRAWERRDADAAAELFSEGASYAWGPYEEPLRGRDAIRARWAEVTAAQSDVAFGTEVLGVVDAGGVARWWCAFDVPDVRIELEGIFLVVLDENGRCTDFREWWNERVTPRD
jgi:hypothetical protein